MMLTVVLSAFDQFSGSSLIRNQSAGRSTPAQLPCVGWDLLNRQPNLITGQLYFPLGPLLAPAQP